MKDNIIDIKLIKDTLAGDPSAFERLYRRYAKLHLLTCLRYMKNKFDAEDVLQEAFIKIYRDLKSFNLDRGTFRNWSTRIIINICLQQIRKKRNNLDIAEAEKTFTQFEINPQALQSLNLKDLTDIISKLPIGYRTVFNLYVIDGYTHKEIAEMLTISIGTSKSQLLRAKKYLQKNLSTSQPTLIEIYA